MKRVLNIKDFLKSKIHILLTLLFVFLLSACSDNADDCGTVQDHMANPENRCLLCPIFEELKNTATKMADGSWDQFANDLSVVVVIVAAISVAYTTLKMVGSFGKQNVADFLTSNKGGLFLYLFKVGIIVFLLQNKSLILQYLIEPVFSMSIEISRQVSLNPALGSSEPSWGSLFGTLYSAGKSFSDDVSGIISVGQTMSCYASVGSVYQWDFFLLITGILIFLFGWTLLFGILFFMADIMIRMLFAAVLLPLGVACAVSKLSITYTKNIWNLFLNVFFNLIILGILINITIRLTLLCLGRSFSAAGETTTADFAGAHQVDLMQAINANNLSAIGSTMQQTGHFVLTLVCFLVAFNLIRQMGNLAESISDTAGFSPASESAAPVAQAAGANAKKIGAWGGKAVGGGALNAASNIAKGLKLDKLYESTRSKASSLRGYLTGTGASGYKAWWRK